MHPAQSGQVQGVATTDGYAFSGDGSEYPPFFGGGDLLPSFVLEGGEAMVEYIELFALCSAIADMGLLIVSIISLMIAIGTMKKK